MEKIKNFITKHKFIDIMIIIVVMLILSYLCSESCNCIFSDRGREFLIPKEILNGAVPYKDITMIYFPLAYYINAFFYKLFGVSIHTLLITQTCICCICLVAYYLTATEFLKRSTSLLLTILIIIVGVFSTNDLFSWIMPYSYSRAYGVIGTLICIFCLIKLFRTDNLKYAYLAGIIAGFSLSCKLEFLTTVLILIIGLALYKKLTIYKYIKIFGCILIFPIITITTLIIQGVSLQNITDAVNFGIAFAKTDVMTEFLSKQGLYPFEIISTITQMATNAPLVMAIILLCFFGLMCKNKFWRYPIMIITALIIWKLYSHAYRINQYWTILPFLVLIITIFNFKKLFKHDKIFLFLLISSLIAAQREFFKLCLALYGVFSFPMLILAICAICAKFLPEKIKEVNLKNLMNFSLIVFIGLYSINLYNMEKTTTYPVLRTLRQGSLYTNYDMGSLLYKTIDYIEKNTDPNASILVLPEGSIINFITNRKVDMHCFMMDRLYHDAYGEEKAKDLIAKTNSDYIVIIHVIRKSDSASFNRPHLYESESSSLSSKYIFQNYTEVEKFEENIDNYISILKKN